MTSPNPLPAKDVRHVAPLVLLLGWHDARGRSDEPMQTDFLKELLRRLRSFEELEYEKIKRDPGCAHKNCVECGAAAANDADPEC